MRVSAAERGVCAAHSRAGLEAFPQTVQRPHPPILVGGGGRLLTIAAREADIVSIFPSLLPAGGEFRTEDWTAEEFERKAAVLRRDARERFADLELHILLQGLMITDDARGVSETWGAATWRR